MLDNVRDRGTKKWTALMLPEHVKELREWMKEDEIVERPELNEWELEAIQMEIEIAFRNDREVKVTAWREGHKEPYIGKISELNVNHRYLSIDSPFGIDRISVEDIIRVESMY